MSLIDPWEVSTGQLSWFQFGHRWAVEWGSSPSLPGSILSSSDALRSFMSSSVGFETDHCSVCWDFHFTSNLPHSQNVSQKCGNSGTTVEANWKNCVTLISFGWKSSNYAAESNATGKRLPLKISFSGNHCKYYTGKESIFFYRRPFTSSLTKSELKERTLKQILISNRLAHRRSVRQAKGLAHRRLGAELKVTD